MTNRNQPFIASLKEAFPLTKKGSTKDTHHLIIDLKGGDIPYQVGDSIAVLPSNPDYLVEKTLAAIGLDGQTLVEPKAGTPPIPLKDFLKSQAVITRPTKKLIKALAERQNNPDKKHQLTALLDKASAPDLENYLLLKDVYEVLQDNSEVKLSPAELPKLFQPLLPRFYSIASSKSVVGDEVHFTVANVCYEVDGKRRRGICTRFLIDQVKPGEKMIPIYLQASPHFHLPKDPKTPIIMVGPGTGIAPFRAFLQERAKDKEGGPNWLFFGDRTRKYDFLYEEELLAYEKQGKLDLDLAFSRDQEKKIYVQDKMKEKGAKLFSWLENGAYFYLCGDAKRMARDVEAALVDIFQEHGKMSLDEAKNYLKTLRKEKRFLKDVY